MNRSILILTVSAIALVLWSTSSISAYQQATSEGPSVVAADNLYIPAPDQPIAVYQTANGRRANPMKEAVKALKDAENDDDRDEAEDKIRELLEMQYDHFLEANEKQIAELQTRLDNLKDQLERRRRAKSKMVDLEMQRVVNESEGLIWPNQNNRRNNFFSREFGVTAPAGVAFPSKSPFAQTIGTRPGAVRPPGVPAPIKTKSQSR